MGEFYTGKKAMRKKSYLTFTDQFCGLGGNTEGTKKAAKRLNIESGVHVQLAMNHWELAIESHNTNHPETDHALANISNADPRHYPSTDVMISSPECTWQTKANGKKKPVKQLGLYNNTAPDAAEERSRATMWDVPRFAEIHRYNYIIIENVWEVTKWVLFDDWLRSMMTLGYNHKIIYHNSQFDWPTPQSRDRVFIHFWKKNNKAPNLEFTPLAYCPCCEKDVHAVQSWKDVRKKFGVYGDRGQYVYKCPKDGQVVRPYHYAAFNVIDWSDLGTPVLKRKSGKPLSPNTIRRINIGLERFLDSPFMVKLEHSKQNNVRHIGESMFTQTTCDSMGFVTPLIVEMNRTGTARPSIQPLATITTAFGKHGLLWPFVVENKGQSNARDSRAPLSSITTVAHHGIVTDESFRSFISYYNSGSDVNSPITNPVGTITGVDRAYLSNFKKPTLEDCFYRSLKPDEVKLVMGFDPEYIVLGNSKQKVKQCGNAVPPYTMAWQVERALQTLM